VVCGIRKKDMSDQRGTTLNWFQVLNVLSGLLGLII
jgi:hypothetical protein